MKIKIQLDKNQTPEEADNSLFKALSLHANGDAHEDKFDDPVMQDLLDDLERKFAEMLSGTMAEIHNELDMEHTDDYL